MTMKKIKLFDYQEDMVKRVQEAFKHHDAVMVQMPTGTGKTYLLAALVGLFLKEEVWVVAIVVNSFHKSRTPWEDSSLP